MCVVYISRIMCHHELWTSHKPMCDLRLYIYVSSTYHAPYVVTNSVWVIYIGVISTFIYMCRLHIHAPCVITNSLWMWYVTHSRGLIYSSRILIKRLRWVIARRHRYMSSRTLNVTNSRWVIYMSPTRSLSGLLLRSLFQVSFRVCRSLWTCVTRQKATSKGNGSALHDTRSLFMYVGLHSFT